MARFGRPHLSVYARVQESGAREVVSPPNQCSRAVVSRATGGRRARIVAPGNGAKKTVALDVSAPFQCALCERRRSGAPRLRPSTAPSESARLANVDATPKRDAQ